MATLRLINLPWHSFTGHQQKITNTEPILGSEVGRKGGSSSL